jgi:hypothetical protein
MGRLAPVALSAAVEGDVDEAVLSRLVAHAGGWLNPVHGKRGKDQLLKQLSGYANAARFAPWVVLLDLDHDFECPPAAVAVWLPAWLPATPNRLCLRVAVRQVEAWLLADRERVATFLRVPVSRVPERPEELDDPKRSMVNLARRSRSRAIAQDMTPRPGSGRNVGPAYASRLIEFVTRSERGWRPQVAAESADSLRRAMARVESLVSDPRSGRT